MPCSCPLLPLTAESGSQGAGRAKGVALEALEILQLLQGQNCAEGKQGAVQ